MLFLLFKIRHDAPKKHNSYLLSFYLVQKQEDSYSNSISAATRLIEEYLMINYAH